MVLVGQPTGKIYGYVSDRLVWRRTISTPRSDDKRPFGFIRSKKTYPIVLSRAIAEYYPPGRYPPEKHQTVKGNESPMPTAIIGDTNPDLSAV